MVGFGAPTPSSDPPSTPDSRSNRSGDNSPFPGFEPSTTPAGPPPSSNASSTPAGQPPLSSSIFGSSMIGNRDSAIPLFGSSVLGPGLGSSRGSTPLKGLSSFSPIKPFGSHNPLVSPSRPSTAKVPGKLRHSISASDLSPAQEDPVEKDVEDQSDGNDSHENEVEDEDGDERLTGKDDLSVEDVDEEGDEGAQGDIEGFLEVEEDDDGDDDYVDDEEVRDEEEEEEEEEGVNEDEEEDEQDQEDVDDAENMDIDKRQPKTTRAPLGELDQQTFFNPFQAALDRNKQSRTSPPSVSSRDDLLSQSQLGRSIYDNAPSAIPSIARSLSQKMGAAKLIESNDLLLATEDIMSSKERYLSDPTTYPGLRMSSIVEDLVILWRTLRKNQRSSSDVFSNDTETGTGKEKTSPLDQATSLATLLLQLHHPPLAQASNVFPRSKTNRSTTFSQNFNARPRERALPLPKVLLNWLESHHDPLPDMHARIRTTQDGGEEDADFWDQFWDVVMITLQRGRVDEVVRLLKEADFSHAVPRGEDVPPTSLLGRSGTPSQFSDIQLSNIRRVVSRAVQLLEQCPAVTNGDWNMRGSDWSVFRAKVAQAQQDLAVFAEGVDHDSVRGSSQIEAEHFGITSRSGPRFSMSDANRMIGSKVPWSVYQDLRAVYAFLSGDTDAITAYAEDWIEATVCLTAWWTGEDIGGRRPSLSMSLQRLDGMSYPVDGALDGSYQNRMARSLAKATKDMHRAEASQVDPLNPFELGVACIFDNDVEGALGMIKSLSLSVASVVAEIGSDAEWLSTDGGRLPVDFDRSDLMVLSYGQDRKSLSRDDVLMEYAEALFGRHQLREDRSVDDVDINGRPHQKGPTEGWELGLRILGRLQDVELAAKKIQTLLDGFSLDSSERVDKVFQACGEVGMTAQARKLADRFADGVAEKSHRYGEALIYYALAHEQKKMKDVLDLLISFCLIQSTAYPAKSEMDERLQDLISSPRETLQEVSLVDGDAANMLHLNLCGYATLRKFYDLRDAKPSRKEGPESQAGEEGRIKQAATALIALINSAGDNIQDGLYDPNVETVVSVDGLLTMLAEAMVFLNRSDRVFTLDQIFALLKVIEDLQSVPTPVYAQCEEFFQSALASSRGNALKKTLSSMTASTGSLIGRSMLDSFTAESTSSGSGVLIGKNEKRGDDGRGWDWRRGFPGPVKGEEVLRILRLGLARELASAWLDEA